MPPTARRLDAHIVFGRAADRLFARLLVASVVVTVVMVLAGVAVGTAHRAKRAETAPDDEPSPARAVRSQLHE